MIKDELKFKIDIRIKSPNIVIPLDQTRLLDKKCWIVSPGHLEVRCDGSGEEESKSQFDSFYINMCHVGVRAISVYNSWKKNFPIRATEIVENFGVKI